MRVELFERWIQVTVEKDSYFANKAKRYAEKHFSRVLPLSNSLLILDAENERVRKDYFLNWACHIALHRDTDATKKAYAAIMKNKTLPIRVKCVDSKGVVEHVQVSIKFIGNERIALTLSKQNRLARRFLISTFRDHMVGYCKKELFLDNTRPSFWDKLMSSMRQRTIHNISLHFDYDKFQIKDMLLGMEGFKNAHNAAYLTKEEKRLRKSLAILECGLDEPFEGIKARYLHLAKEYHPDTVYGQDEKVVSSYVEKFRKIQEAYEVVKNSVGKAA